VATYSTSILAVGSHNITATYPGTAEFDAGTSNVLVEQIADFRRLRLARLAYPFTGRSLHPSRCPLRPFQALIFRLLSPAPSCRKIQPAILRGHRYRRWRQLDADRADHRSQPDHGWLCTLRRISSDRAVRHLPDLHPQALAPPSRRLVTDSCDFCDSGLVDSITGCSASRSLAPGTPVELIPSR